MKDWSAYLRASSPPQTFSADDAEGLAEVLYRRGAAVGSSHDGSWISAQFSFHAVDLERAFGTATEIMEKALAEIGADGVVIDYAQLMTQEDLERELSRPAYPELVGIQEIAKMLGVTRQRASALAASPHFPRPLVKLAAGPVWPKPWIARFVREWDRRPVRKDYLGGAR